MLRTESKSLGPGEFSTEYASHVNNFFGSQWDKLFESPSFRS